MIRIEPRLHPSKTMVYGAPILAVGLTLIAGALLFGFLGYDPLKSLYLFFIVPISDNYGLTELLLKATPLTLCAVGLAVGFRGNVWNIGAEGQLTMGAIAAGAVAVSNHESTSSWLLVVMIFAGILGGMAWAAIPAFLKTRFHANEILTSLMLTYVAALFLGYVVNGPLRNPEGFNFPESRMFPDVGLLPLLVDESRLHIGALIALFVVVLGWVIMTRTLIGFQVKVVGLTPLAAHYAGFSPKKVVWMSLLIGGGLAGLAGMFEVAGPIGQLQPVISPGYGFTAIIVAFLGRLHPIGILCAALLVALSYLGGETVQMELSLPLAVTGVFQGMLLFFLLACDVLINYRFVLGLKRKVA
ncbi:putative permease from ABC transporter [Candidatus Terasakiella magnetica]|uniref:Putative permease from ABC transporter n=1 Tax=Candidatus Terasakiella magnetica TaxID=1867952 RepID=A0A1C3RFU7_9PROT|nr:ABC transporter permease [Candidatus Terasakiella magnetica]SCA56176.1 putative permease from ABC transporter [Candidatus Terasakiella magnetica]